MPFEPETIAVLIDSTPAGWRRASLAVALARRWNAHVTGIHLVYARVQVPPSLSYALGTEATRNAIAYEDKLNADAEAADAELGERFRSHCAQLGVDAEFHPVGRGKTLQDAIRIARNSDLAITRHAAEGEQPELMSPDGVLIAAGVPVLVVPDGWEGNAIGDRVVIGWNESPEARRAISGAMAIIVGAKLATVLVINPGLTPQHGAEPGADIASYLARHGAHVEVDRADSSDDSIAETMLRYAVDHGADLLVLGAYSHARWREVLFGGTTKSLMKEMPVPVLISN